MLFWAEDHDVITLEQKKIRIQKFAFFEFPNHDHHSTALWFIEGICK